MRSFLVDTPLPKSRFKKVYLISKKINVLAMLFLSLSVLSESMTEHAINHESINRTYLKYIPADLDLKNEVDLFIGIHGYTGTATGFEKQTTGGFNDAADKYKFLAVYPQGLYFNSVEDDPSSFVSSWNDLAGSKTQTPNGEICAIDADIYPQYPNCSGGGRCAWASCSDDLGFIKKIIDRAKEDHKIRDIYLLGMSNGGMMAQALACKYPSIFRGVVNVVGMQQKDLSCIPKEPVNFIIYGSVKDTVVPPINIRASDGYFYEPMEDTFNAWSKQFECKTFKKSDFNLYDDFEKNIASGCKSDVQVISLLNKDAGHFWPGIDRNVGFCYSPPQSNLDYSECNFSIANEWGNDFLINLLFDLKN
tara:strand:+ start:265 stop:1353 length:1089 start_codon:yes stop_codon:yes gene_type:complete